MTYLLDANTLIEAKNRASAIKFLFRPLSAD